MPQMTAEIQGMPKILALLTPKTLYWGVLKGQLEALGARAAGEARSSAGSFQKLGNLAGGIEHKVNSIPVPLWAVVTTSATSKTGRRYPWILEYEGRYGHRNWLRDAIRRAQAGVSAYTDAAASQIEAKWGS